MTYASQEESEYTGSVAQLVRIELGNTAYYLTSAESDIVASGNTYLTDIISDSGFVDSGDSAKNEVEFSIRPDHAVASYLLQYIPTSEIVITVYRLHRSESPQPLIQQWEGVVLSWECVYPDFKMTAAPVDYELGREMMARRYGPDCQWTQYGFGCGLSSAAFAATMVVDTVSGVNVTLTSSLPTSSPASSPEQHYLGGYVEYAGTHGTERARIVVHGATTLVLDRVLPGMVAGLSMSVIPSCRGQLTRCDTYFSNDLNFLGAPYAELVNPFDGDGNRRKGDTQISGFHQAIVHLYRTGQL